MSYNFNKNTELFIVTNQWGDTTIESKKEIQDKLLRDSIPQKIQKIEFKEDMKQTDLKYFVPKRYQTKEILNDRYWNDVQWNKIWNGEIKCVGING